MNFDRIARAYRWLEYISFGPYLERARNYFLPQLGSCRNALVLGDGDGRFTARLLQRNREIRIDAVDISPAMLRLMAERVRRLGPEYSARLTTFCADARSLELTNQNHDLIVTHFFLDCFSGHELLALFDRMQPLAAPNALWLISEFEIPQGRMLAAAARRLIRFLYFAFRSLTGLQTRELPDWRGALERIGFRPKARAAHLAGLLISALYQKQP